MARRALEARPGKGADSLSRRDLLAFWLARRGHVIESMRTFPDVDRMIQFATLYAIPSSEVDSLSGALRAAGPRREICSFCAASAEGIRGDTARMRQALEYMHGHPDTTRIFRRFFVTSVHAWLTLALHDTTGAMREFAAIPDSICNSCGFLFLTRAQLFYARGKYAEAAKVLDERGVKMRDNVIGAITEFERGRVAEKLDDKPRAREAYQYVADMWQHGDPAFERYVAESRAGLKRLTGESGATQIPLDRPPAAAH